MKNRIHLIKKNENFSQNFQCYYFGVLNLFKSKSDKLNPKDFKNIFLRKKSNISNLNKNIYIFHQNKKKSLKNIVLHQELTNQFLILIYYFSFFIICNVKKFIIKLKIIFFFDQAKNFNISKIGIMNPLKFIFMIIEFLFKFNEKRRKLNKISMI